MMVFQAVAVLARKEMLMKRATVTKTQCWWLNVGRCYCSETKPKMMLVAMTSVVSTAMLMMSVKTTMPKMMLVTARGMVSLLWCDAA